MRMTMTEYDVFDFINMCNEYVESSKELREAAALCDGDPIKQDMVSFIVPDFDDVCARSEAIKSLLDNENYIQNRQFIFEELKAVTAKNLEMARKIREKLEPLLWN